LSTLPARHSGRSAGAGVTRAAEPIRSVDCLRGSAVTNHEPTAGEQLAERLWRAYLTGDNSQLDRKVLAVREVFRRIPGGQRCIVCNAPFTGPGGALVSLFGFGAGHSSLNPSLCDRCEKIVKSHEVGVEVDVALVFADVLGSTALADEIGLSQFHRLIGRFYRTGVEALIDGHALIEKLIGDEVAGIFAPGIGGPDHCRRALEAGVRIVRDTGHASDEGPWIPVGVGVHGGEVYAGAVGTANRMGVITVLGDTANVTARLAGEAGPGEILATEHVLEAAGVDASKWEQRILDLKGRTGPLAVRVLGSDWPG
jgi:adenylate cyclase